jgi:hypothetical protein
VPVVNPAIAAGGRGLHRVVGFPDAFGMTIYYYIVI